MTSLQSILYPIVIKTYKALIHLAALQSDKAKKWVDGRHFWREELRKLVDPSKRRILIHAASLGEMEQGTPVLRSLRKQWPDHQIFVSFFSPSGYEYFKETELCDAIIYLPLDEKKNSADFAEILKPELALFIKYEIWPFLLSALKKVDTKLILAPAVFRANQIYFKGDQKAFFRRALLNFDRILVQDSPSLQILEKEEIKGIGLCGDSRFERALENKKQDCNTSFLKSFIKDSFCLIAGSSWKKEEILLQKLLQDQPNFKLILAPHDISNTNIQSVLKRFSKFGISCYSKKDFNTQDRIILIDSIGQLRYLYRLADLALIGGGFGKGVHNTIEAIVYHIPVLFGPKRKKFPETEEMIQLGLAAEIQNSQDLEKAFLDFQHHKPQAAQFEDYIQSKLGASQKINAAINELLSTSERN